jgi:hypothetical protein
MATNWEDMTVESDEVKSKLTPGEWRVRDLGVSTYPAGAIETSEGLAIVSLFSHRPEDEAMENARLQAASKDLLKACCEASVVLYGISENEDIELGDFYGDRVDQAIRRLTAAIEKSGQAWKTQME